MKADTTDFKEVYELLGISRSHRSALNCLASLLRTEVFGFDFEVTKWYLSCEKCLQADSIQDSGCFR